MKVIIPVLKKVVPRIDIPLEDCYIVDIEHISKIAHDENYIMFIVTNQWICNVVLFDHNQTRDSLSEVDLYTGDRLVVEIPPNEKFLFIMKYGSIEPITEIAYYKWCIE